MFYGLIAEWEDLEEEGTLREEGSKSEEIFIEE